MGCPLPKSFEINCGFNLPRLLRAALQNQTLTWDPPSMAIIADHCNDKKLEAKRVGERSCELYLALFIQECGPVDVRGVVLEVRH